MSTTYYVFQPFIRTLPNGDLMPTEPRRVQSEQAARRLVAALPPGVAAAIAFSRTGVPGTGYWEDAVILSKTANAPVDHLLCGE